MPSDCSHACACACYQKFFVNEQQVEKETFLKIQKILKKDKTQKQIEQKEKEKRICDLQKEIENIKENLNTKNSLMKNLNRIHK